ncbi:MAG: hypothetical protein K2M19_04755 [Muribaculaceae bacterium]|nr:hypothetical protein [Muribaculaceae bacterium]
MKKFYLLALAAVVTFGASARFAQTENFSVNGKKHFKSTLTELSVTETLAKPAKAPTAGATLADYEGIYTYQCEWGLSQGYAPETLELTVTDATTGEVEIAGFPQDYVVKGTLDLKAGTLSLPNMQNLGTDSNGDVNYFYLKAFKPDYSDIIAGATSAKAAVGTINGKTITFPEDEIWAIGDPRQEDLGYWFLTLANVMIYGVPDPNEGWEDWGEATFQDGWVLPAFGIDQTKTENHYKVAIQKSTVYEGTFRLVNPYYGHCPAAQYNTSKKAGYIEFDVSDPDHVYFIPQGAGFANAEIGLSEIYCFNTLTYYCIYYQMEPANVVAALGDKLKYSTYKNNVLTVPYYYDPSTNQNGEVLGWVNDACFGDQEDPVGGYWWTDENDETVSMETKIFFDATKAGVEDIAADAPAGAKEYFNLQGVRVANPSDGVYIVRQNGKATKEYIR